MSKGHKSNDATTASATTSLEKLPTEQQTVAEAAATKETQEAIPRVPARNQDADQVANNQRNIVTPTGSAGAREIVHADGRKEQVQVSHDKDGTQNYYVRNEQGELNQYKVKDNHTLVSDKGHELSLKTQLEPDRKQPESPGTAVSNSPKEASRAVENPSQNKSEQKQEQLQQKFEAQKAEHHFESQQKNLAEEKREKYPQVDPAAFKKDDAAQVKISESDRTPGRAPEGLLRSSNELNSKAPDSLKDIMKSDLYPNGLPANQNDKVKSQQITTESNRTSESSSDNSSSKNLTSADRNAKVEALNDSSKQLVPSSESQQLQQHKVGGPLSSIGDGHKDTIDKKSDTPSGNDKNTKFELDPKAVAALLGVAKGEATKSSGGGGGGSEKSEDKKADRAPVSRPGADDKSGSRGVGTGIGSDRGSDRTSKNPDRLPPDAKPELKAMLTQTDLSHRNILATVLSQFQSDSEQNFSTKEQPLVDKLRELTAEQIKALNAWVTGKQGSALDTHNTADYQHKLTDILKTLLIPADKNVVSKSPEAIDSKNQLKTLIAELTKQQTDHLSELVSKMLVSPGRKLGGVDQLIGVQLRKLDSEQLSTLKECLKSRDMKQIDKIGGDLQFTLIVVLSLLSGKADKHVAEKDKKIPAQAQPTKEVLDRVDEALKVALPKSIQCDRGRPARPDKEAAAGDEDINEKIRAQRKKDRRTKTKRMKESAAADDATPVDENQTKEAESNKEEEKVEEQRARSGSDSSTLLSETPTQKVLKDKDNNVVRITRNGDLKTKYRKTLEWWNEDNWHLVAEFKLDYGTGYLTKYKRNSNAAVTSRHNQAEPGLTSMLQNTFDRNWREHVEQYK